MRPRDAEEHDDGMGSVMKVLAGMTVMAAALAGLSSVPATAAPVSVAKLTASDQTTSAGLGYSVAVGDGVIVAGAPGVGSNTGAVYVFSKPALGWGDATQLARLTASDGIPQQPDGSSGTRLGTAIAVDDDTIAVGAAGSGAGKGAVYVFQKPAGGWVDATETAKLTAIGTTTEDILGTSVAISGDTIVAGAPGVSATFARTGSAYVFTRSGANWLSGTQTATLNQSDRTTKDFFGSGVAISPDSIAVGAPGDDTVTAGTPADDPVNRYSHGSVYIFARPSGGWVTGTETAKLVASDGESFDELGSSVAISGGLIASGAPCRELVRGDTAHRFSCLAGNESDEGAVYLFEQSGSPWTNGTQTAILTPNAGDFRGSLGSSVAIDGTTIASSAPGFQAPASVKLFQKPAGDWDDMTPTDSIAAGMWSTRHAIALRAGTLGIGVFDGQNYGGVKVYSLVPNPVTNVVAEQVAGTNDVTVSWSPPSAFAGPAVSDYVITINEPGSSSNVATASTSTSHRLTDLTVGADYSFTVRAVNSAGMGAPSPSSNSLTVVQKCGAQDATIVGTTGDDTLVGTSGPDVIVGLGGNDVIDGKDGADAFCGGDGIDTVSYASHPGAVVANLTGGSGDDGSNLDGPVGARDSISTDVERLIGGSGNDTLVGNGAANLLTGGAGNDVLSGSAGNDRLVGGVGNDSLVGGTGADTLDGGSGVDYARYGDHPRAVALRLDNKANDGNYTDGPSTARDNIWASVEALLGGPGDDVLVGSSGNNSLDGAKGADTLYGLGGNDYLKAKDGVRDKRLDGGTGTDASQFDTIDPPRVSVP